MSNKQNAILQDSGIERSVLAGITSHGADCLYEIENIITTTDFYWTYNQRLFNILAHLVHQQEVTTFDMPSIQAVAKTLGYDDYIGDGKYVEYLDSVMQDIGPSENNILILAASIYKLSTARKAWKTGKFISDSVAKITGEESIDEIIGMIEEPVFKLTGQMMSQTTGTVSLGSNFQHVMSTLEQAPKDIVGLPTGFPAWDLAIGGGLQPSTVNVVGARSKQGKSFFCMNVARNVAENNIPVLYLDTELTYEMQLHRLTSLISGIELNKVRTGQFAANKHESDAIWSCQKCIEQLSIDHHSIAGQAPSVILSIARRWLAKKVGFTDTGGANPCLIIYDYIKLMDSAGLAKNLQEYQVLGFLMTELHNFAVKYRLPVLATVQLNKDGEEKEGTSVMSGSDRITWLSSNFSILKRKNQQELTEDPPSNGKRKLLVTVTRFGPGMEEGEYINIIDELSVARLKEGKLFSTVAKEAWQNEQI